MKMDHCPHCHTRSGLNNYCTLLLSFENWPLVILLLLVVHAFGEKLALQHLITAGFAVLAVAPLLFQVMRKTSCDNCGMEFRSSQDAQDAHFHDVM